MESMVAKTGRDSSDVGRQTYPFDRFDKLTAGRLRALSGAEGLTPLRGSNDSQIRRDRIGRKEAQKAQKDFPEVGPVL
jgi:hypothetical protein